MFGESGVRDGRTFVFLHGQHGQIAIGRQLRQCVGRSVGRIAAMEQENQQLRQTNQQQAQQLGGGTGEGRAGEGGAVPVTPPAAAAASPAATKRVATHTQAHQRASSSPATQSGHCLRIAV